MADLVNNERTAQFLGVTTSTVDRLARQKLIPSIWVTRKIRRFDLEAIKEHLARQNRQPVAAAV